MTYTALASLVILGDDLSRVDVSHITAGEDRVPSVAALANTFLPFLALSLCLPIDGMWLVILLLLLLIQNGDTRSSN